MNPAPVVLPPGGDLVGRVERRAIVLTIVGVVAAWIVPGGSGAAAAGVAGGALLAIVSFRIIKRGVDSLTARAIGQAAPAAGDGVPPGASPGQSASADPIRSPRPVRSSGATTRGISLFVLRYALLAGMAYVMIARLRLPPIGLLCGASVTMLAAAAEVMRRRPS